MSTDEEYLDSLLKSMSNDEEEGHDEKMMSLLNEIDPMKKKSDAMKKEVFSDIRPEDELLAEDSADEDADTETKEDWNTPEENKSEEKKPVVDESWKAELDEMLAKADQAQNALGEGTEDATADESPEDPEEEKEERKSWRSEDKLLTRAAASEQTAAETPENLETVPDKPDKKKKKKKHSLFGKKKKGAEQDQEDEKALQQNSQKQNGAESAKNSSELEEIPGFKKLQERAMKESAEEGSTEQDDEADWTSILGGSSEPEGQAAGETFEEPNWADEIPEKGAPKKKGFFGRIMEALFREEPEEEIEESGEILKKKEKKGKGKAKDKKMEAEGDEEGKEVGDKKVEKKKAKQQKKEEKKRQKEQEPKPPKVLTKKALFTLITFDATVIAAILLLGVFLPDYIDRRNAREAFYDGDYVTVYQDLHGKGLGESDTVLLNRSAVVEKLQRKLDSYEINERTGNQAQALDALLSGIAVYDSIMAEGNTYGAESELTALYQQITDALQNQFQVDEATAREVNAYESDDDYSEAIYSLIHDGRLPGEETEEVAGNEDGTQTLQDLLPEEEDLMESTDGSF